MAGIRLLGWDLLRRLVRQDRRLRHLERLWFCLPVRLRYLFRLYRSVSVHHGLRFHQSKSIYTRRLLTCIIYLYDVHHSYHSPGSIGLSDMKFRQIYQAMTRENGEAPGKDGDL